MSNKLGPLFRPIVVMMWFAFALLGCTAIKSTFRDNLHDDSRHALSFHHSTGSGLAYCLPKGLLKLTVAEQVSITYLGSVLFQQEDFTRQFTSNLKHPPDAAYQLLWSKLTQSAKDAMSSAADRDALPDPVVQSINDLVQDGIIYDAEIFPNDKLSAATRMLLDQHPSGIQANLLNRFLLEDIFGTAMAQNGKRKIETKDVPLFVYTEPMMVPDRDWRYLLKMKPSILSDDYFQLKVTNGLLQSVTLTNYDQTAGILSNLLTTAIEAAYAAGVKGFAPMFAKPPVKPQFVELAKYVTTNACVVDPFDRVTERNFHGVKFDFSDFQEDGKKYFQLAQSRAGDISTIAGVYYRPLEAYKLHWESEASGAGETIVRLPNKAFVFNLTVKRRMFVKQTAMLVFEEGIPISVTLNKPSEIGAIASFPVTVTHAFTVPLSDLIPFKITTGSQASSPSSPSISISNNVQIIQQSNAVGQAKN